MKWPFLLPTLLPKPLTSHPEQLVDGVGRLLAELREDARVGIHGHAQKIASQQVEINKKAIYSRSPPETRGHRQ